MFRAGNAALVSNPRGSFKSFAAESWDLDLGLSPSKLLYHFHGNTVELAYNECNEK